MDKRELSRIVRTTDDGVVADPTGKRNGRGTYLCDDATCWDKVRTSKVLDRELRVEISAAEKAALIKYLPHANNTQLTP